MSDSVTGSADGSGPVSLQDLVRDVVAKLAEADTKYLRYVAANVSANVDDDAEPDVVLSAINQALVGSDDTDLVTSLADETLGGHHEYLGDSLVSVSGRDAAPGI